MIKVTKKQYEIISKIYRFGGFAIVLVLLIGFSIFIHKPIEFTLIFLPYFITKNFYEKQYHSNSLKECFIISLLIFGIATIISIPKQFSISFAFVIGTIIAFISYKVGDIQFKIQDYEYIEPRYNILVEKYKDEIQKKPFNTETCTYEELMARCNELRLSRENTELCIEFFIFKTKQSIIADRLCIDEKSVTMKKLRLKQKLNNN